MTDRAALRRLRARRASPIRPVQGSRQDLPLSFAQERLWLLDRLMSTQSPYLMRGADRLRGPLDVAALRHALNQVVARHEALRTSFPTRDGRPVQHVTADLRLPLPVTDLSALDPAARDRALAHALADDTTRPFDLTTGPLLRAELYRLDTDDHVLVLVMHHIVSDGWSMTVFFDELTHHYDADRPPPAPLPIQYADYAQWQRRWLTGDVLDRQLDYWRQQLHDAPPLLELPSDRPRPAIQSYRGARLSFTLPADLTAALRHLARDHDATLFMVLTTALATLLHRYSGQTDLCIGTPVANRTRVETEPLIGYFANTLVLRVDATDDPTFTELLDRVRTTALGAYDHQDVPFERLVQELQPNRSLSHTPLFQVMFVLQNTPAAPPGIPGIDTTPIDLPSAYAKFDLWLSIKEGPEGLSGTVEYSTDLFEPATVRRMVDHLRVILAATAADPRQRIDRIPLLDPAERDHVLTALSRTTTTPTDTPTRLIHERVHDQARATPDLPAVTTGGDTLTYERLHRRANQLAHHLRALGAGPDDIVATYLPRSTELVTALLATLIAGAAYLPLDPDHPPHRTAHLLEDAGPAAIVTTADLAGRLPTTAVPTVVPDRDAAAIARHPHHPPDADVHPDNLAYVIYTSGSTGRPKGVMSTHRGIANRLAWMQERFRLTPEDRVMQKTPATFDVSVWEFFWPLMTGACLVVAEPDGHRDPDYLARTIRERGVTVVHFVPSMLAIFLDQERLDCPGLRAVVASGEVLPPVLVERFFDRLPHAELHNLYGPTEASVDVTAWRCLPGDAAGPVPIGRPVTNTQTYILDSRLQPVP
ncbi:MAG TPA: condensation domain-containing protein, partial [Micromonosporaceae bacterium]|nr:condensation domain-containing protein [Micromonosporaceae bacterium]